MTDYSTCSPADRLGAIEQLGALLSATTAELLQLVVESDRAEDWKIDGATGMAPWLVAALRVSSGTAREWVKTSSALADLPALSAAFGEGSLSWEQVRPAARYATPATDGPLARELPGCTVAQIEAEARRCRPRPTGKDRDAARQRRFGWRPDAELGGFHYRGFLPADRAERLNNVLTRMAEQAGPEPSTGLWDPFEQRAADALCDLADARAANDTDPEATLVVIHTDAGPDGQIIGNGMIGDLPISQEGVLRHLCDSKVEHWIDTPDGVTIGIGRLSRNPPRWLRRRIQRRDGCCRFPGCGRPIRHRHHLRHWTRDGPTDANNLIGVCWFHHHLVHEGGWTIEGNPEHEITFISPYGRRLSSRPPPIRPDLHQRARRAAGLDPTMPQPEPAG